MYVKPIFLFAFYLVFTACNQLNTQSLNEDFVFNGKGVELADSLMKYVQYQEGKITLMNVTLIDGTGGDVLRNQTIVVEDGRFKNIGKQDEISILPNTKTIDCEGKTIIPGLVGVHNHLHIPGFPFIGDVATKMYLACGVTTIQTCGSASPYEDIEIAKAIAAGEKVGPDVVCSGPYFTGEGGSSAMVIPRDEQHIKDTMQYWLDKGVSWFKVYRHTKPEDLQVIIDKAHENEAKVTGHFCSITFEEATKMGIDGVEHGLNSAADFRTDKKYGLCGGGRAYMDELIISSAPVVDLHQLMIDNEVFLNSTMSIYESSIAQRASADVRTLKAMSPYLVNQYEERRKRHEANEVDSTRLKRLKRIMAFEYQFFKMGGLLGAGCDAGRHNMPGFGDQRNYELFIEAGFTPEEAIMVMSQNGANILEKEQIGSIEIGKRADFVILDGDLSQNAALIRRVETVFKSGIGYDSKLLLESTNGQVGL